MHIHRRFAATSIGLVLATLTLLQVGCRSVRERGDIVAYDMGLLAGWNHHLPCYILFPPLHWQGGETATAEFTMPRPLDDDVFVALDILADQAMTIEEFESLRLEFRVDIHDVTMDEHLVSHIATLAETGPAGPQSSAGLGTGAAGDDVWRSDYPDPTQWVAAYTFPDMGDFKLETDHTYRVRMSVSHGTRLEDNAPPPITFVLTLACR